MPDSAPDPKVEDVLSSVRRLVSQELPKRSAPKPAVDPGALVLTSQDRIEADPTVRTAERTLEQRIAELEAAVDSGLDEFEPDGSEDQAQHRPDRIVYTRPRPSEEGVRNRNSTLRLSEIALIETGPANDVEPTSDAPLQFRHGGAPAANEAPMAEDVPTLPAQPAEVRAFSDPDDVVARIEARIERGGEAEPDAPVTPQGASSDEDFDDDLTAAVRESLAAAEREAQDASDTLEDKELGQASEAAAVATGPSSKADRQTPDVIEAETTAQATEPKASVATETPRQVEAKVPEAAQHEDEVVASEEPVAESSALPDATVTPSSEEPAADTPQSDTPVEGAAETPAEAAAVALGALPDDEAMRLLVARLLREELSGELGERITRNVRKLVRREVHRLLDSRELD